MANGTVTIVKGVVTAGGTFASGDLVGEWVPVHGDFMFSLTSGFSGTVKIEATRDKSAVYALSYSDFTAMSYSGVTAAAATPLSNPDPWGFVRVNASGVTANYPTWAIYGQV